MTNNTEQQAVTVAQIDREAAADWMATYSAEWDTFYLNRVRDGREDGEGLPQAFARHRLASVSSASAEGFMLVPREPTQAMVNAACAAIEDTDQENIDETDTRFWGQPWQPCARAAWSAMLAASPEPVPATNQAGEVGIAAHAKRMDDEIYCWWECPGNEIQPLIMGLDVAREFHAELTAALATQPATSQEGEGKSFALWSTETLANQCRMQAHDQLDPEFSSFLTEVADRLATQPATSQERDIPEGMKAWFGGDGPPDDWDGGFVFRRALGLVEQPETEDPAFEWLHHPHGRLHDLDIIAYTPKILAATPTPPTLSDDLREAIQPLADVYITGSEDDDECVLDVSFPTAGHVRAARTALALARAQEQGS